MMRMIQSKVLFFFFNYLLLVLVFRVVALLAFKTFGLLLEEC